MTAAIFAGGEQSLPENFEKADLIICADRGYKLCLAAGFSPDVVLGDFDSSECPNGLDCEIIRFSPQKDDTDSMLAIKLAIERGAEKINFYGGLGGRLDHTIANIQALEYAKNKGVKARILSRNCSVEILSRGAHEFKRLDGWNFSIFSFGEKAEGVSLSGFEYNVENAELKNDFPLGVSNKIKDKSARLSFERGELLVVQTLEM